MKRVLFSLLIAALAWGRSYTTNFPNVENPISEGGNWTNGGTTGLDWNNMQTSVGLAWGVGPASVAYSDPTAVINGLWGADQSVTATAYIASPDPNYYQEVELRLRTKIRRHSITGYEINFGVSHAYTQIVRWNGRLGDFTIIGGSDFQISDGDTVQATIIGNQINVYANGVLVASATDSTFTSGDPGMGVDFGCGSTYADFGFTSLTATDELGSGGGAPVITQFLADPTSIQVGQFSTLSWKVTGQTTNISINQGIGAVPATGNITVSPGNTTTYTLTAIGPGGSASANATVGVATTGQTLPSFVQVNQNQLGSGTAVSVTLNQVTTAGNTIVIYVIWDNVGSATVADSSGNNFVSVSSPIVWDGGYSAQIFYATNITGGMESITATFGSSIHSFGILYAHEYSGINTANPVDVTVSATGSSAFLNSGAASTTSSNDLIFGAGVSDNVVTAAGSGFNARDFAYGNITEDSIANSPGSYNATATHNGNVWAMQMVAFRPAN